MFQNRVNLVVFKIFLVTEECIQGVLFENLKIVRKAIVARALLVEGAALQIVSYTLRSCLAHRKFLAAVSCIALSKERCS